MNYLTPEAPALLQRIADYIRTHSERFDMNSWVGVPEHHPIGPPGPDRSRTVEACRTTCCVAGWACILHRGLDPEAELPKVPLRTWGIFNHLMTDEVTRTYAAVLGLQRTFADEAYAVLFVNDVPDQMKRLFYADQWPSEWCSRFRSAGSKFLEAHVTADFLEEVIRTQGRILEDDNDDDNDEDDDGWTDNWGR